MADTAKNGGAGSASQAQHWRLQLDEEGIAWLCLNRTDSGANTLSTEVMAELDTVLTGLTEQPPAGLVIYSGKEQGFINGADVKEFPQLIESGSLLELIRRGQQILGRLEQLPCPSLAVLNGFTLGGGLELALACGGRLAFEGDEPVLGFPEVQLGLHPGFGGTVRAPRLVGVRAALQMMMTGKALKPAEALRLGLVDRLTGAAQWRDAARALLRELPRRRVLPWPDRLINLGWIRPRLVRRLAEQAAARAPAAHYPAPYAILDLWARHGGSPQDVALEAEARSFAQLAAGETARNLIRVFFLQERLKGLGSVGAPVGHVHVIGAGVMGGDIAAWCALRGLQVTLQDREAGLIEAALGRATRLFERRLSAAGCAEARARLRADLSGTGVAGADVVIEAIFEDLRTKQDLYAVIEPRMKPEAILASNTSSIPLQELAGALRRPERLVGLHFFNPVAKLPLVEVVLSPLSGAQARDQATAFVRQIGKLPLPCRSQPGFLVNRILAPYMAEALELAREGVPLPEIDLAATAFGMPMGPIELADSVGLDIALHVARILAPLVGRPVAPELEALVEAGHLGVKAGRGFYTYENGRPVKPRLADDAFSAEAQDRLILALLNEAAACLEEGIVEEADLVDAGVIFGTGFAPFRGGPLHYARRRGIDQVVARLEELAVTRGLRFRPSPGWQRVSGQPDSG